MTILLGKLQEDTTNQQLSHYKAQSLFELGLDIKPFESYDFYEPRIFRGT
jgi:hypothetical protein